MWVKSTEGIGSTFYFTIAYLPVTPEDEPILAEIPVKPAIKPFAQKTVLLVEPTPIKSIYYDKLITSTGATVVRVDNIDEWSDHLAKDDEHFDMVVADGALVSDKNSDQIKRIINVRPNIPVAFIVSEKNQSLCQNLGKVLINQPVGYAKFVNSMEKYAG